MRTCPTCAGALVLEVADLNGHDEGCTEESVAVSVEAKVLARCEPCDTVVMSGDATAELGVAIAWRER